MELLISVLLGIVQGLTEFLPISSSGHLIIFRDLTGTQFSYGLAFDSVLQFATTLAIIVYFRKEIFKLISSFYLLILGKLKDREQKIMIFSIIIGTIPAVFFGFILEDLMDTAFRSSFLVAGTLVLGSILMYFADKLSKNNSELTVKKSFFIGLFQSLALIPGMSRSGMTIVGGLFLGLRREMAIKFSFLLAVPVLFGSGMKKMIDIGSSGLINSIGLELFVGSIAAFLVGLLAIRFMIIYLKNNSFNVFIYYRLILAGLIIIFGFINF